MRAAVLVKGNEPVPVRLSGRALVAGSLTKLIAFNLSTLDGVVWWPLFLGSGLVLLAADVRCAKALTARRYAD